MKYFTYITVLILSLSSCVAQKNNNMEDEIIIPEITKKSENFDVNKFQTKNTSLVEEKSVNIYTVYTGDKKDTKKKSGFSKSIFLKNSCFSITKNFFPNGKIDIKGVTFNNGSEYGIWYEFDEEGNLLKEINMDEGYNFGWKDVLKYCNKNEITLEKGFPKRGGIKTEIFKNEEEGKKVWTISYFKTGEYLEVTLDGKTGKELKKRTLIFEGS